MIYDEENETITEVKEILVLKNETKILISDINQTKNNLQGIEIKSITGIVLDQFYRIRFFDFGLNENLASYFFYFFPKSGKMER